MSGGVPGNRSWCQLAQALPASLPCLQVSLVFFQLNLLLGSRGKRGSTGKADHTSPLITGEVGADGVRKMGLRLVWNDYSWGGKERGCPENDLCCSKVQKGLAGREFKTSLQALHGILHAYGCCQAPTAFNIIPAPSVFQTT